MNKILIVDDEPAVRYSFKKLLKEENLEVLEAADGVDAMRIFRQKMPDLVVMDIEMPGMTGLETIRRLKEINPQIPVIVMTAFGSTDRVIEAMKQGAYEYLEKPFDIGKMRSVIREALETRLLSEGGIHLSPAGKESPPPERIVGNSQAIKEVYKLIGRVAASDAGVLITGESGTGKELVARAIHMHSNRADKPFLTINCAAIPDSLLESELFGYEKGSFTDASKSKAGKFETADTGTIFLDEIGDMSLPLQSKLLRVIQEGTFERLGSNHTQQVDVRIIAATNKNLEQGIIHRTFREDLYYRLKVITITLPPLRMRREDIPLLTEYFIARHNQALKNPEITIPRETMDTLLTYAWPGNVRELENVIKRALLLSKNQILTPDLLSLGHAEESRSEPQKDSPALLSTIHFPADPETFEGNLYRQVIDQAEKELLRQTLIHTRGNQVKTAKLLGISRVMLHHRMKKYSLGQY
ncbi:MAG: sigma-54-dependent Fis family transcriptional regulator [Bacteroidetes bacterium]|nr:MAG: sigma-54-dependent Fis family transcriptional regulator [Bacteroidota bacterium]